MLLLQLLSSGRPHALQHLVCVCEGHDARLTRAPLLLAALAAAPIIYKVAAAQLGVGPESVICIGDSLEHDIGGAAAAGLDSLLIAGGIHAADLLAGDSTLRADCDDQLARLTAEHSGAGAGPTFVLPRLAL